MGGGPAMDESESSQPASDGDFSPTDDPSGMRELLDEASTAGRLRRGEVVEGVVVQVGRDEILVDVGSKAEAIIPAAEAGVPPNEIPDAIHVGETIVAMVVESEDHHGNDRLANVDGETIVA